MGNINMKKIGDAGFTFLEIVIAISILAFIMSVTYSALASMTRTKKLLDDERDSKVIADSVLGRMTRELQLAYSDLPLLPPRNAIETLYPKRVCLLAEPATSDSGLPLDKLTFLALEGGQYLPDGGTHSGVVQISYRPEANPEQKGEKNPTYLLIREETPYTRPFDKAYKRSMIFPITNRLESLEFRFYDDKNEEWSKVWGKPPRVELPSLIRFSIVVRSGEGRVSTFTSSVAPKSQIEG